MPIVNRVADLHQEITAWRRDLHAHPELRYDVHRTAASVADRLKSFGCDEVVPGIGRTGVVGVIRGRKPGKKVVGMRADMDALPIEEETGLPYQSTVPGKMHACGHDGHTAMLLGAAKYLAETRNFAGTAVVVFQPAEEGGAGAAAMIKDGLISRFGIDEVYGMHNYPGLAVGEFAIRAGPMMAAADHIEIALEGKGGHAARPHLAIDTDPGRRADHQSAAVDRGAQRRSARSGRGVDLHVPGRPYRQRHPAARHAARHITKPFAEPLKPAIVPSISHAYTLARLRGVSHPENLRSGKGLFNYFLGSHKIKDILEVTGPGMWTDAVLDSMNAPVVDRINHGQESGTMISAFTGLQSPKLVGEILVLPINYFGTGQRHSGSAIFQLPEACVNHMARRSWK